MVTLTRGNLADGSEYVRVLGRFGLQRVKCRDIELTRFLVSVIRLHAVVQRQIVSGKATSHHCSMCSEHGSYRQSALFQVQDSGSGLPLMELSHNFFGSGKIEAVIAFDNLTGHISEKYRFLIIPVTGNGVYSEFFPVLGQNSVSICKELLEVHEDSHGTSRHVPSSDTHSDATFGSLCFPVLPELWIFLKVRIRIGIHPNIRTYQNMMSLQLRLEIQ